MPQWNSVKRLYKWKSTPNGILRFMMRLCVSVSEETFWEASVMWRGGVWRWFVSGTASLRVCLDYPRDQRVGIEDGRSRGHGRLCMGRVCWKGKSGRGDRAVKLQNNWYCSKRRGSLLSVPPPPKRAQWGLPVGLGKEKRTEEEEGFVSFEKYPRKIVSCGCFGHFRNLLFMPLCYVLVFCLPLSLCHKVLICVFINIVDLYEQVSS